MGFFAGSRSEVDTIWSELLPSRASMTEALAALASRDPSTWPRTNLQPLHEPLSDQELGRRGYRPEVSFLWEHLGPRWAPGFTIWSRVLPDAVREQCISVLRSVGCMSWSTSDQVFGVLKELSGLAKKGGDDLFPGYWKYLVDMVTMTAYVPPGSLESRLADVKGWVSSPMEHTLAGADYDKLFREGVARVLDSAPHLGSSVVGSQTVEEFVSTRMAEATGGSSDFRGGVEYESDRGSWARPRRTKVASFLSYSDDTLREWLTEPLTVSSTYEVAREVEKSERGKAKARSVIMSGDRTHWRMAFVGQVVESMMSSSSLSTLWMSPSATLEMWLRIQRSLGRTWQMPLDASSFDETVSASELRIVMEEVIALLERIGDSERAHTARLIAGTIVPDWSPASGGTSVSVDGVLVRVRKGVLSGWRWTAWIDTVVNLARVFGLAKYTRSYGYSDPVSVVGQGDDDQLSFTHPEDAAALYLAYREANIDVNPSKFFLAEGRDEFLRIVVEVDKVAGYPARGIGAVLWKSPLSSRPRPGPERIRETFELWNLLACRGMDPTVCFSMALDDASSSNELPIKTVRCIALTPATVGGSGVYLGRYYTGRWLSVTPSQPTFGTRFRGISESVGSWLPQGLRAAVVNEYASTNLTMPKVKVEWKPHRVFRPPNIKMWEGTLPRGARVRTSPPMTVRSPLMAILVGQCFRTMSWEDAHATVSSFIDPRFKDVSVRVLRDMGKAAWRRWVSGDLPIKTPIVWGLGPVSTSVAYRELAEQCFATALLRKGNLGLLKSLLLRAEFEFPHLFRGSRLAFGV